MNRFLARLAIGSAAILIASAGGCVALVFLIVAFYLLLTGMMAPWLAALATAGAALLFSLLVLLIARPATRSRVPQATRNRHRATAELGELLGRQAHNFVSANSPTLLALLLGAGFAVGFSPRLRKILMKLL
jgi:ABC-type protease/lipase transport system fused ATPase/permease subunit